MLSRWFHAWEHRLASVSKDRVVRPFDWGLDWLPTTNGDGGGPAEERVRQWVDAAMQDTPAFFATPATDQYEFTPATPDVQASGEAGTVRYPSALTTPHPENNLV